MSLILKISAVSFHYLVVVCYYCGFLHQCCTRVMKLSPSVAASWHCLVDARRISQKLRRGIVKLMLGPEGKANFSWIIKCQVRQNLGGGICSKEHKGEWAALLTFLC